MQHVRGQGVLGRRGFAVGSAAARCCREAGGRVATNLFMRNMDVGVPRSADSRRLEVVVDGLPLFGGVQLAIDFSFGTQGRRRIKARSHRSRRSGPCRSPPNQEEDAPRVGWSWLPGTARGLGILEVGGRWSEEAKIFVRLLARARARSEPRFMQRRVEQAWRLQWYAIISCATAKSFAAFLLEWRSGHGSDGQAPPSHEVERDQAGAG